jgi:flagellar basal body-associated protein FliL
MTQKPKMTKRTMAITLGVVCIAIIAGVSIGIIIFYSDQNGNKIQGTKVPELVSVDMQFKDNRTNPNAPFLQVTGRIHNEGNATANNCTLHMVAVQNGNATAIDEVVNLNSIEAGAYKTIDLTFNYTGEALVAYNSPTLDWTN